VFCTKSCSISNRYATKLQNAGYSHNSHKIDIIYCANYAMNLHFVRNSYFPRPITFFAAVTTTPLRYPSHVQYRIARVLQGYNKILTDNTELSLFDAIHQRDRQTRRHRIYRARHICRAVKKELTRDLRTVQKFSICVTLLQLKHTFNIGACLSCTI